MARRPVGGVGGRGEGGSRRGSPTPCPGEVVRGPRPSPPSSPAHPPWVYTFSRGCQAAPGAGHGLAGSRWTSLAGGAASAPYPWGLARGAPRGGRRGGLFAAPCSPAFSRRAPRRVTSHVPRPPWCIPGCRRSAAARGAPLSAGAELPVGSGHCGSEWAVDWGHSAPGSARRGCGVPPLGAAALPGGVRGRRLPGRPPAVRGLGGGRGGGGRRGGCSPQSPPGPLAPPPGGRGRAAWWFRSRGASRRREGRTLPPPPFISWVPDPRAGPRSGPPLYSLPPRGTGGPGGGGGLASAGGRRFGSAFGA